MQIKGRKEEPVDQYRDIVNALIQHPSIPESIAFAESLDEVALFGLLERPSRKGRSH